MQLIAAIRAGGGFMQTPGWPAMSHQSQAIKNMRMYFCCSNGISIAHLIPVEPKPLALPLHNGMPAATAATA